MKKDEIKVKVKIGDIFDAPYIDSWDYICDKYGLSVWCVKEGTANREDEIEISLSDAEYIGLIED